MSQESSSAVYSRSSVQGSALGDEIVFFDERAGKYFATGSVGADIWSLLERPMTMDEICEALMEAYEVDRTTCFQQVSQFLGKMAEINLVEVVTPE
ncbi:HPr-rel-A system PqqD family peptide chaperone [Aquidulcibacter sp.]|uniref:HPr-rel-A system PqqD family peptide chaperone n=1 Tax=Aquidulcibacter sp. TaxID=2052990 RepID=UPI0025BDD8C1|nr:HPr-rel-A system PqqD family peptide chaperone [Aquidulcibacter sp.]MCA3693479.1 HPr-rel-A system PqqD family peptide chaperone [Aquidulcibacter sp.]